LGLGCALGYPDAVTGALPVFQADFPQVADTHLPPRISAPHEHHLWLLLAGFATNCCAFG
jgi:hypothetical protein